jgi:hypothetical protein
MVSASRGGVGVTFQTLGGEQQRLPCQAGLRLTRGRDCHRKRDSPPEGLSFGFFNIGDGGCQSKKDDT